MNNIGQCFYCVLIKPQLQNNQQQPISTVAVCVAFEEDGSGINNYIITMLLQEWAPIGNS